MVLLLRFVINDVKTATAAIFTSPSRRETGPQQSGLPAGIKCPRFQ